MHNIYIYIEIYTFCLNIEMSICLKTTQPCAKLWSWNRTSLGPEVSVCRFAERCLTERRGERMRTWGKMGKIYQIIHDMWFFDICFVHWTLHKSKLDSAHLFSPISLPSLIWKPNTSGMQLQKPDLSVVDGGDAMVSPTSAASWGWEVQETWGISGI